MSALSRRQFLQAAAASGIAATAAPAKRPNIVFLMADEFRADAMGCAGNPIVQTPNLDHLAGQGVRFSRTYCQGPLCQPSCASLMTGEYVHQHGQTWNRFDMKPEWPTFMKALQAAGYFTAGVGKFHFSGGDNGTDFKERQDFAKSFGFDWMFEEYEKLVHARPNTVSPYTEYLKRKGLLDAYRKETPQFLTPDADPRQLYRGKTSVVPQQDNMQNNLACELFDLEKDPGEMRNLVNDPEHAAIREEMHSKYTVPFIT